MNSTRNPKTANGNALDSPITPTAEDRRKWETQYPQGSLSRQTIEGWGLFAAIIIVLLSVFLVWRYYCGPLRELILAAQGGLLGGLLQDSKFFYKSVGEGDWIWDKSWWRLLTPLVSATMGFSVYILVRAGMLASGSHEGKEDYYAYTIGFLTGLFADNALQKLRDIAYTLFGQVKEPPTKPKAPRESHKIQSDASDTNLEEN
ncbi:MAG TPA: hypothetical protein VMP68_03390 [Candidatus Eisenbacteria bacterium]|nr:hypothetical protein [Candidatus Eisenbacteria bacterium]